jgi:hypothetical protein
MKLGAYLPTQQSSIIDIHFEWSNRLFRICLLLDSSNRTVYARYKLGLVKASMPSLLFGDLGLALRIRTRILGSIRVFLRRHQFPTLRSHRW